MHNLYAIRSSRLSDEAYPVFYYGYVEEVWSLSSCWTRFMWTMLRGL